MLDSPYVRRVAISLKMMGIGFDHSPLSVFRQVEEFSVINPLIKAPTLVTDDAVVLMDSGLILDYAETLPSKTRSLMPASPSDYVWATRLIGLALVANEKTVQTVYETNLRPAERQHQPWLDRVGIQLAAAYRLLEESLEHKGEWLFGDQPLQPDITAAVAWRFTQLVLPHAVAAADCPKLAAFSARAEALPEFLSTPVE
jgi:glutathione S-transferase